MAAARNGCSGGAAPPPPPSRPPSAAGEGPDWAAGAVLDQCRCRAAVKRAYAGLCAGGVAERIALEAAVRVYRYHHPEQPPAAARHLVETWVYAGPRH